MKQKELSVYLRAIVILGAFCVLMLGGLIAPELGREFAQGNPEIAYMFWPCLIFIWITAVPVTVTLVLVWLIAVEIGRDNSFCLENAARLRTISLLAAIDTVLYFLAAAVLAGLKMLHISIFILISGIIAVGAACIITAAALSHLTRKAADLKADSDLTI